jgi:hypothetical protein
VPAFPLQLTKPIPQAVAFRQAVILINLRPPGLTLQDLRREIALMLQQVSPQAIVQASHVFDVIEHQRDFPLEG